MANIGSIHIRCFRQNGFSRRIKLRTLQQWFCPDESYCVPVWTQDWLSAGVVDFQYGSRHASLLNLRERWPKLQSIFSTIWVRSFNDSDDEDRFRLFHIGREKYWSGAYYAYDSIKVLTTDNSSHQWQTEFEAENKNRWQKDIHNGRYKAMNERVAFENSETIATYSTETKDTYMSQLPKCLPESLSKYLKKDPKDLQYIDLFWRDRRVKRIRTENGTFRQFCCDHWDNFRLPEYLQSFSKHRSSWQLK